MKRPLAAIICCALVCGMSAAAYASGEESREEKQTIEETFRSDAATETLPTCPPYQFRVPQNIHHRQKQYRRPRQGYVDDICNTKPPKFIDSMHLLFESDFVSKYFWQGLPDSEGPVWQPSMTIEALGFGLNIWGNFVLGDEPNQGEFNEVDIITYYSKTFSNFTVSPAFKFLVYPNADPASLNYSSHSTVKAVLAFDYQLGPVDFFGDGGVYIHGTDGSLLFDVGANFHYRLIDWFSVDTTGTFSIADGRWNRTHIADVGTQVNLFTYTLALDFEPVKGLSLVPNFNVSTFLPPSLRNAVPEPTQVWGGLNVVWSAK